MRHCKTLVMALFVTLASSSVLLAAAEVGQQAPDISLKDTAGKTHNLADHAGKIVVLEWINPQCPFVERHYILNTMTDLAQKYKDKDVVWMAIATGHTADANKLNSFAQKHGISYPILLDADGKVGKAYDAKTTPHMYIIDKDGKLAYAGAIDSEPNDNTSAPIADGTVNYVDKALSEMGDGTSVSQPESKPYGCTVKYKD